MTDYTKLAEALGLKIRSFDMGLRNIGNGTEIVRKQFWVGPSGYPFYYADMQLIPPDICKADTDKQLELWFSSPEGEKAVRDKVRQAADSLSGRVVVVYEGSLSRVQFEHRWENGWVCKAGNSFIRSVELEAWVALLLWLAGQKATCKCGKEKLRTAELEDRDDGN